MADEKPMKKQYKRQEPCAIAQIRSGFMRLVVAPLEFNGTVSGPAPKEVPVQLETRNRTDPTLLYTYDYLPLEQGSVKMKKLITLHQSTVRPFFRSSYKPRQDLLRDSGPYKL